MDHETDAVPDHTRQEPQEARKESSLEATITSLLEHMPGMTFTKDAETGVYVTCNQMFADYAHKASPEEVYGLRDADLFDAETAAHFTEMDQVALSMEKPYIYFEDAPDAFGQKRLYQTIKRKHTDETGRLLLQGVCQDVTDIVRLRRENADTKEAYQEAQNYVTVYTHVAHALARDYTDLYYVNMESDEFLEFYTDDESGVLSVARAGMDFFEGCERDARQFVHP